MASFIDWMPHIMSRLNGMAEAEAQRLWSLSANIFCLRTGVWRETVEETISGDLKELEIVPQDGTTLLSVHSIRYPDGFEYVWGEATAGGVVTLPRAFTGSGLFSLEISVVPVPGPRTEVPDHFTGIYFQPLLDCTLAQGYGQIGKPWSNLILSNRHQGDFDGRVAMETIRLHNRFGNNRQVQGAFFA